MKKEEQRDGAEQTKKDVEQVEGLSNFEHEGGGGEGDNPCPPGYKWSTTLKRCVADPG